MRILITGGNTQIPIDKVRVISNIFKGKTAMDIANLAIACGHEVTLIGNPNMKLPCVGGVNDNGVYYDVVDVRDHCYSKYRFIEYKTYSDLYGVLNNILNKYKQDNNSFDAIIHSAAVSDYEVEGIYHKDDYELVKIDNSSKVSSEHKELFLKLTPTEKIVDKFREWGYNGKVVKFKLQVDISDAELIKIAQKSRATSDADLIVANCLEWAKEKAFIIDRQDIVQKVKRKDLANELLMILEAMV